MAIVNIGNDGLTLKFGDAIFDYDSTWSLYTEAHNREFQLTKAGYSVRRTELLDLGGKLSKRGINTMLYSLWIRKGRVQKTPGRKPARR